MLLLVYCAVVGAVTISNTKLRRDVNNRLMDIHDGGLFQIGSTYYYYGMGYQNCTEEMSSFPPDGCPGMYKPFGKSCGFLLDHAVNLYSSPDLQSWTFIANVFPPSVRPPGIYYRPKIIYNNQTQEYVLWINFLPEAVIPLESVPNATYVVAASKALAGPFHVVTRRASMAFSGGGDFALLVDYWSEATPVAYIAYDAWENLHRVTIEKLTPNYYDSLGANVTTGPISSIGNEAPILFHRNGWFYLMFGALCCFCQEGSDSFVWTAKHPLGPWTDAHLNVNIRAKNGTPTIQAQENFVFEVWTSNSSVVGNNHTIHHKAKAASKTKTFVYMGDRWHSAPDNLKSHDLQYWEPLVFDDSKEPPLPLPLKWENEFDLKLLAG
eukprot:m.35987 g.35987  ORF g.35987 m.35987 type:complete len:380 (-) comp15880_c0_seq1:27-1166(-)